MVHVLVERNEVSPQRVARQCATGNRLTAQKRLIHGRILPKGADTPADVTPWRDPGRILAVWLLPALILLGVDVVGFGLDDGSVIRCLRGLLGRGISGQ